MASLVFIYSSIFWGIEGFGVVGSYKFWDSISNSIIYDHSGYGNHATYSTQNFYFTDRGIMIYGACALNLPSNFNGLNEYPGYKDFALSYWYHRESSESSRQFLIQYSTHIRIGIFSEVLNGLTRIRFVHSTKGLLYNYTSLSLDLIDKWRLYTFKFTQNPSNTESIISVYIDLTHIYSITATDVSLNSQSTIVIGGIVFLNGIIYEMWWHKDVSDMNELDYLLVSSNICSCNYGCVTSPATICLPNHGGAYNSQGQICSPICPNSCNEDFECIHNFKTDCISGLYHRESGICLFYCPDNSCVCSSTLDCSCKIGYKKVSDNPPACIPVRCLSYERRDYKYTCNECESGYVPDSNGDTCVCDQEFRAVSYNPLICIHIPNCLAYTQVGDKYLCLSCSEGYMLDSDGYCNECANGYTRFSTELSTCMRDIENCSEYSQFGMYVECLICRPGFVVSISGLCDDCDIGYLNVSTESVICKAEILNCIEYDMNSEKSECTICEMGYELDNHKLCNICKLGHFPIAYAPLTCIKVVNNCKEYTQLNDEWLCKECESGWYLSNDFYHCLPVIDSSSEYNSDDENGSSETIDSNSYDSSSNSSDQISEYTQAMSKKIKSSTITLSNISLAFASASSVLYLDPGSLIRFINDIKLLSYIILINISLPYEVQIEKRSSIANLEKINIFSHIKIQNNSIKDILKDSLDDEHGFISKIAYEILSFTIILLLNFIFNLLKTCAVGKLKSALIRGIQYICYTAYIQFSMLVYLDVLYYSLSKILNVIYIQPEENSIQNLLDYNLAVLSLILCTLYPAFLASFIIKSKLLLKNEEFIQSYGYLVNNLKEEVNSVYYHVLFLIRRFNIVASVLLFHSYPYAQTVICSASCWAVIYTVGILTRFNNQAFQGYSK